MLWMHDGFRALVVVDSAMCATTPVTLVRVMRAFVNGATDRLDPRTGRVSLATVRYPGIKAGLLCPYLWRIL